ncbi:TPA: hypothetical protein ACQVH3_004666 [Serratia marcescens]
MDKFNYLKEQLTAALVELEAKDAPKDIRIAELEKRLKQRAEEVESHIAELEAHKQYAKERDALAVENAALKYAITTHSQSTHFCELCGKDDPCSTDDVCYALKETPATDAALAAIQAQGVDKLINLKMEQLANMHPDTHAFGATAMSLRAQINELQAFAARLREGK